MSERSYQQRLVVNGEVQPLGRNRPAQADTYEAFSLQTATPGSLLKVETHRGDHLFKKSDFDNEETPLPALENWQMLTGVGEQVVRLVLREPTGAGGYFLSPSTVLRRGRDGLAIVEINSRHAPGVLRDLGTVARISYYAPVTPTQVEDMRRLVDR